MNYCNELLAIISILSTVTFICIAIALHFYLKYADERDLRKREEENRRKVL